MNAITCPTCRHTTTAPTTNMATTAHKRHSCTKQTARRPNPPRPNTPIANPPGEWVNDAACARTDPEAFFPEKGETTKDAKKVCGGCRVIAECLKYALTNGERYGVFGGLSERERRRLRKAAA